MVGDNEHPVQNDMLAAGSQAPDFTLIANDLSSRSLADYAGQVKVISVIPSIDTGVCAAQTRRFNAEAAGLKDTVVLTVSADMPFALGRFCGAEGIENTETLTTQRDMQFADDYGVHDTEWRVCQRAVFVLGRDNVLRHVEYVPVIGAEVDYDAALAAARSLA
ncbi:MAG: thiol peroxidase [Chloroflexi bacterium]|nr:thiol peroxidase [Chloroflexota bacterium]MCY4247012.1 thiol peroxidase [Chloroflexota bacterium]